MMRNVQVENQKLPKKKKNKIQKLKHDRIKGQHDDKKR